MSGSQAEVREGQDLRDPGQPVDIHNQNGRHETHEVGAVGNDRSRDSRSRSKHSKKSKKAKKRSRSRSRSPSGGQLDRVEALLVTVMADVKQSNAKVARLEDELVACKKNVANLERPSSVGAPSVVGDDPGDVPFSGSPYSGYDTQDLDLGPNVEVPESEILSLDPNLNDSFICEEVDEDELEKGMEGFSAVNRRRLTRDLLYNAAGGTLVPTAEFKEKTQSHEVGQPGSMMRSLIKEMQVRAPKADPKGEAEFQKYFGAAPSFRQQRTVSVFPLDQSQVDIVKKYYRSEKPDKLFPYATDSQVVLKAEPEFEELLKVPVLDDFLKYVNSKSDSKTKDGFKSKVNQQLDTLLKRVHTAARVNILASALGQRVQLKQSEMIEGWLKEGVISEDMYKEWKGLSVASFDASNRALEQAARTGGLTHQARRRVCIEDMGVVDKEKKESLLKLPLDASGIMGAGLQKELEEKADQAKLFKASAEQLGLIVKTSKTQFDKKRRRPDRSRKVEFHGRGRESEYPYQAAAYPRHEQQQPFPRGRGRGRGFPRGRGGGASATVSKPPASGPSA